MRERGNENASGGEPDASILELKLKVEFVGRPPAPRDQYTVTDTCSPSRPWTFTISVKRACCSAHTASDAEN